MTAWTCVQGKSTLANHLLERERSLTGPEPGLTRDTVRDSFQYEGQRVELADTAGWLKQAQIKGPSDLTRCSPRPAFACHRDADHPSMLTCLPACVTGPMRMHAFLQIILRSPIRAHTSMLTALAYRHLLLQFCMARMLACHVCG